MIEYVVEWRENIKPFESGTERFGIQENALAYVRECVEKGYRVVIELRERRV